MTIPTRRIHRKGRETRLRWDSWISVSSHKRRSRQERSFRERKRSFRAVVLRDGGGTRGSGGDGGFVSKIERREKRERGERKNIHTGEQAATNGNGQSNKNSL